MRAESSFPERVHFKAPEGLSSAVSTAAKQDHCTPSEFLRRAVIGRLREVGVPLVSGHSAAAVSSQEARQ